MPPKAILIGTGAILATNRDFVNGYQAGHLAYMVVRKVHPTPLTDQYLINLFLDKLEDMNTSSAYGIGYAVGWLNTLARKGGTS